MDIFKLYFEKKKTNSLVNRLYFPNGKIRFEVWWKRGTFHRTDGPAYQTWFENGQLEYEKWYLDGKLHRIGDPAVQVWDKDGLLLRKAWWINDFQYTKEDYWKLLFKMIKQRKIKRTTHIDIEGLTAMV